MRTNSRLVGEKKSLLAKEITNGLSFLFIVVRDNRRNYPGFL